MTKEEIIQLKNDLKVTWVKLSKLVGCSLETVHNWIYKGISPSQVFERELHKLRKGADIKKKADDKKKKV
ncbi:hypothetical protein KAR91_07140 [Candidatus Pacearchaeota archaeon]|nr:hypothetical protein [Candidatus Pacearchaeota archaeon]